MGVVAVRDSDLTREGFQYIFSHLIIRWLNKDRWTYLEGDSCLRAQIKVL
jgi:hypothetical protein